MTVTFLPLNRKIEVEPGISLEAAAVMAGIDTGGVCSGRRTCGKCKVLVTKGNNRLYAAEEMTQLLEEERDRGIRLACCIRPEEDTCVILINDTQRDVIQSTEGINNSMQGIIEQNNVIQESSVEIPYVIAIDLGTTTLEAALYNKTTGELLRTKGILNPQRLYGADVVSRITYAIAKDDNAARLRNVLIEACNSLIRDITSEQRISEASISSIALAGNTTMTNLFLGRSLKSLSRVPFQSESYEGALLSAIEAGLDMNRDGKVYVMPGIGGHVGGDALSCILATNLHREYKRILLMDIGTNGELILCNKGSLTAVSAAAGPAFEGGNISCGMRAEIGAITSADYSDESLHIHYIGEELDGIKPKGICGSGLIDCLFELYINELIDETGRLLGTAGEENLFRLWSDDEKVITLTQKDIREFQLAKGAIKAGVTILLKEAGIESLDLDFIYLAGNFGGKLSAAKAIGIGLLPDIKAEKVTYIGNGALLGSKKLLAGEISAREAEDISQRVKHVELALHPDFQEEFIKALSFPSK